MTNRRLNEHLSAESVQALLEGEVPQGDRGRYEEHLALCTRCSAELEAWRALLEDLDALPSLAPGNDFAGRVMTALDIPGQQVAGAARHVEPAVLQDYLDGTLGRRRRASVEAHLAACGSCTDEVDAWAGVFARLGDLDRFRPTGGFARGVMAGIDVPARLPLAARARAKVAELLLVKRAGAHLDAGRMQDLLDGIAPARQVARMRAHLVECEPCASELGAWQAVLARLDGLERYEPGTAFAERVMGALTAPSRAPLAARAPRSRAARSRAPMPEWSGALAWAARLVPRHRRAWAAISGVAVTPAVVSGLVLYVMFSHPTLTPASLASFVWWQIADLATAGWSLTATAALESVQMFGLYSLFEALASAPIAVASGVLAYALVSAMALRVLYKNFFVNRPLDGRYAYVSTP